MDGGGRGKEGGGVCESEVVLVVGRWHELCNIAGMEESDE